MLKEIEELITPRIITCVGGAYPGGRAHALDVPAAKDVIGITRSNACIIHIPPSPDRFPATCIPIVDLLAAFHTPEHVVPLLNTSRAATSKEALWMIDHGLAQFEEGMFGYEPLIKLEILDQDLRPVHEEVLRCLASLSP